MRYGYMLRNACRSGDSMRRITCRHSTLAIDDHPLVLLHAVRALAPGRVGVGVVEGVDRIRRRDLDVKAVPGRLVEDGKLHLLDRGMPKQQNFVHPTQPLGEFT